MGIQLTPEEVLEFLEKFIEENGIGDGQHISTLLDALADTADIEDLEGEAE